jgi:hypothetical protein
VAVPKRRLLGCEAGHAGLSGRPRLPSRTLLGGGVRDESLVERVADAPLERTECFLLCLSLREFAVVVAASRRVRVTDLGDRSHVDRMVQLAIAAPRQAMHVVFTCSRRTAYFWM